MPKPPCYPDPSSNDNVGGELNFKRQDRYITSIGELIEALDQVKPRKVATDTVWFRGQADSAWKLLPNIARDIPDGETTIDSLLEREREAFNKLKQNAYALLNRWPDENAWDWAFIMQHHRGFTRLLDWTENPLVALYFAVKDDKVTSDATLWCLDPRELNATRPIRGQRERRIFMCGVDEQLDEYKPPFSIQQIKQIEDSPKSLPSYSPVAAMGIRNTTRMVAQSGVFTIMHRQCIAIEDVQHEETGGRSHIWRFLIAADAREAMRKQLEVLGVTRFSLFPELETLASQTREMFG